MNAQMWRPSLVICDGNFPNHTLAYGGLFRVSGASGGQRPGLSHSRDWAAGPGLFP